MIGVHSGSPTARRGGPTPDRVAVGIDVGTTNTKLALVSVADAEVRALASAPTPEPAQLAATLHGLLTRVLEGAPAPEAVGIASMAETGVPLDAGGEPLGPWLRWDGQRAQAEADGLSRRLGWAQLVAATGVRPSAKVPLATWAWLGAHQPERFAAMASWAGAADLVCLLLTGRLATDHTLAGRTMAYLLPADGAPLPACFDAALLAEAGVRPEQLPAVVPPGGVAGQVRAFTGTGLRHGTPVVVAGHDHAVGAYAAGVRAPGDVADSLGTAEAVLTVVAAAPDPVAVAGAGMSPVVTVGGRRGILAGSSSAGALVGWWLERESGGHDAGDLFARALALGERPGELLVLPYLSGRQAPAPDPAAGVRIVGRRPDHTPPELAKAMLEGLCLQARWMLAEQARLAGEEPAGVTVLGSAVAANPAWLRIKARVMPVPLRAVTASEPVAAGAALVAAARAGALAEPPVLERRPVPAGVPPTLYDAAFAAFVAAATGTCGGPHGAPPGEGGDRG